MAPNQVIESVQNNCLYSQLENQFDPQEQDQLQIQTVNGVTLTANVQSSQKDKKVFLVKSSDKPFFLGTDAYLQGELRPKRITSIIDADSGLIRLAEEARNNQKIQYNIIM